MRSDIAAAGYSDIEREPRLGGRTPRRSCAAARLTGVSALRVLLVGGPTAVLEYGGLRLLTDPTFSPPGEYAGGLVKTTGPAIEAAAVGQIDVVLLSHDHHSDNLDPAGRELLSHAGTVLTTPAGAARLGGNAEGLEPWSSRPVGNGVTVTAVPALHG